MSQKQAIVEQALALQSRQAQVDDPDILPEVTKDDIPVDIANLTLPVMALGQMPVSTYQCGTNGLVYEQLILELPALTPREQMLMPLFNSCLTEVGSGGRDYLETQSYQASVTGGLSARSAIHSKLNAPDDCHSHFIVSGKALNRNHQPLASLIKETLFDARFDEHARLKDLVGQIRSSIDHGITGNGHGLAMMAAVQNFTPTAQWQFQRSGFAGIQAIKELDKTLKKKAHLEQFAEDLSTIAQKLCQAPKQALLISDEAGLPQAMAGLKSEWSAMSNVAATSLFSLHADKTPIHQAWVTSTQVNFCALAYPAVMADHADAPKLAVLGACLRNGFLHSAIREKGGAYGGGASYNSEASAFVFYSYRDPRLLETYDDFNLAQAWLMSNEATQAKVDEAILNVISAMDKPGSPAGEAKKAFYQTLYGRTHAVRMAYRQGVISTTVDELRTVAERYLSANNASRVVLTNKGNAQKLVDFGFETQIL
ncbi:insulinase family protein [Thiomicrorhabdus aquaedulcis]|uniref:insulinase family protein n=1 Tax=Thiomicrorhabdus aquaedulcis TaxID=2211106 RepID=UPI001E3765D7|nr:insulinase family protein [Thiomicrorhabdus aquaedulcis]